jgi:hypothetical protein
MLKRCTAEFVKKNLWLFIINFIGEYMYSYGRSKISDLLNRPVHEFLGLTFAMIPRILFCNVNIWKKSIWKTKSEMG